MVLLTRREDMNLKGNIVLNTLSKSKKMNF